MVIRLYLIYADEISSIFNRKRFGTQVYSKMNDIIQLLGNRSYNIFTSRRFCMTKFRAEKQRSYSAESIMKTKKIHHEMHC